MNFIEPAPLHTAPLLRDLSFASKAHWGYAPEIMGNWRSGYQDPTLAAFEEERVQALKEEGDELILGYYALSALRGDEVSLTHLFLRPSHIGKGLGHELLVAAMVQAKTMGGATLKIVSDPHAERFYTQHGAICTGAVTYQHNPDYASPVLELRLENLQLE